jgi:hypothetical protein
MTQLVSRRTPNAEAQFDPTPVHVRFVTVTVTLGQDLFPSNITADALKTLYRHAVPWKNIIALYYCLVFSLALQLVSRGFLITHDDTPQSVRLIWTSDQLVAET